MKRSYQSVLTAAVVSSFFSGSDAADRSSSEKPNVLFVVFDDLSTRLGCYGDPIAKTPNLDRLAERGVVFERAYCQQPICGPSRASFMSGRRPDTLGIWSMISFLHDRCPDAQTMPQWFMNHGYTAMSIGKVLGGYSTKIPGDTATLSVPDRRIGGPRKDEFTMPDGEPLPPNLATDRLCENRDVPDKACFDTLSADLAISELQTLAQQPEPFFLALGFFKPHTPYKIPKRYWDLYKREEIPPIEAGERPLHAPDIAFHANHEILGEPNDRRVLDTAAVQEIRHGYYAAMSFADAQFGRVLDELDRLNLSDHTIIVIIGDNGFHLGEHDTWGKMTLFNWDARVPMIFSVPQVGPKGVDTFAISELIDIFPTLTELCGLPDPEGLDGTSLVPVLKNPAASVKTEAIIQYPRHALYWGGGPTAKPSVMGYSLCSGNWCYNQWRDFKTGQVVAEELYDTKNDPLETVNLSGNPEYKTTLEDCQKRFAKKLSYLPDREQAVPPVAETGRVYFQQDFDRAVRLQDIVSSAPGQTCFNSIDSGKGDTLSIVDGALQLHRIAPGISTVNRSTPLAGSPLRLFCLQMDVNISFSGQTAGKSLGFLQLYNSGPESVWGSPLNIVAATGADNVWGVAGGNTSFSDMQTVRVYVNASGATQTYKDPAGSERTLFDTFVDVWVGSRMVRSVAVDNLNPANPINGFRFVFPGNGFSSGTVTYDNLLIQELSE